MKQKAFTLLEILLVIAAIGILAAIVIVAINPQRQLDQVRTAEVQNNLNTVHKAIQQYLIDHGGYPETLSSDIQEVCATESSSSGEGSVASDCVDLRPLVPQYLAAIPESPFESGETGIFAWIHSENDQVAVYADTTDSNGIGINHTQSLVTEGLITHLDPKEAESYPGTGQEWFDLTNNNYHASLVNGVTFDTNQNVFSFNGTDGFIRLNDLLRSELSSADFSISFWVNRSDREETIIGFVPSSNVTNATYIFARQSGISNFRITNNMNLNTSWQGYHNKWTQVTITFDNSIKRMRIYFDGALQDQITSNTTQNLNLNSSNMDIGRDGRGHSYMDGLLSQILIYDRELNESEVKANYISFKEIH